jgi:flagellar assembly protein FliH
LSFNKSISFPTQPSGFKVSYIGKPDIPVSVSDTSVQEGYNRGKQEATVFYQAEVKKLREEIANRQNQLLGDINQKVLSTISELENRLPDLVLGIAERVLGQSTLDGNAIEQLVKSMISEFSEEDEKLEVFLAPADLELLKGLRKTEDDSSSEPEEDGEGFASAIAGIFDGLDGDDALLSEYPEVKFFEDESLKSGDCQIKSRFGLLDGRIATKLRKIEEELKGND